LSKQLCFGTIVAIGHRLSQYGNIIAGSIQITITLRFSLDWLIF